MRTLLNLTTLMIFSLPSFAKSWRPLEDFIKGTTWCLEDSDGLRAGGRLQFRSNGTGKYDVFDAPGSGGIAFTWETWENSSRNAVVIRYASGFKPKKQFGDVLILKRNRIVFTWSNSDDTVSFANRCNPSRLH